MFPPFGRPLRLGAGSHLFRRRPGQTWPFVDAAPLRAACVSTDSANTSAPSTALKEDIERNYAPLYLVGHSELELKLKPSRYVGRNPASICLLRRGRRQSTIGACNPHS